MVDRHGPGEIAIFRQFATAARLNVTSIEKREPHEPDILCSINGAGQVAFELVQLIDKSWAKCTGDKQELELELNRRHDALKLADKAKIGNAYIYVAFNENAVLKAKKDAIPNIFDVLMAAGPSFKGELCHKNSPGLSPTVLFINVTRLDYLSFEVAAIGDVGDPMIDALREKWANPYVSKHPIELLAYYKLQPEFPEECWRPALENFLSANWMTSPFRRIWIYDCGSNKVRFSAEKP